MTEPPACDEVTVTMQSLLALESPTDPTQKPAITTALRQRVARVAENDLSDLESMLTCQAQLLHHMFTKAVSKYAASTTDEASRMHGNVALKSQAYSRMTVNALNSLKSKDAMQAKLKKPQNELLRNLPYASLERGRKATPKGADPWLAAMEEELWEQNGGW